MQGGKFGNNELIKETFVFEIFCRLRAVPLQSSLSSAGLERANRLSLASLDFLTRAFLARATILRDCSQSKYFGKYFTFTVNQKLWWMYFTTSQHMHVSGPIQIYKSNKARRSVLWKLYVFFYQQDKDRKQKLLSISWQFANVTLAYVTDSWVSRSHKTLWWLEIPGGGGGTPIWNRRGCSSEILNLTPKGDQSRRGLSKFWPLKETV